MRMYRTGDLGKLLADGCLIHMGRKDFQTKIRGHRVELGEVETTLMEHPDVREAVVTAIHDDQNNVGLSAYVTARDCAVLSVSQLIQFAKSKLPHYMVPARFTVLPELPLTGTGKIDRKALPQLDRTRPELDNPFSAPRSSVERELTKIWSDVLGLNLVGIHDEFLELGGDSLHAMQIINRVSSCFDVSVSMNALFLQASTVAEMGAILEARGVKKLMRPPDGNT
jgi:acyl carrier protein